MLKPGDTVYVHYKNAIWKGEYRSTENFPREIVKAYVPTLEQTIDLKRGHVFTTAQAAFKRHKHAQNMIKEGRKDNSVYYNHRD